MEHATILISLQNLVGFLITTYLHLAQVKVWQSHRYPFLYKTIMPLLRSVSVDVFLT